MLQQPLRFDFTPFIGYRTSISLPVQPDAAGTNSRVVINANPSYGVSFGFRLDEEDLIEMRWVRQDSSIRSEDITPALPRQRLLLDQFHGDFSHEYLVEKMPRWERPFVMASVGATHVSSTTDLDFTRFSFGIGGGVHLYASRYLGFKMQAEWLPILVDPHVSAFFGFGCVVHVGGALSSQGEVIVGPQLRF